VGSIFPSPDGEWIAFNDPATGSVKKIPSGGGVPVTIVESGLGENTGAWLGGTWGPDGTIVFATLARPGLLAVSENGGPMRVVARPAAEDSVCYGQPSFLPDGGGIVFTASEVAYPWEQRIMLLRFEEGAEAVPLLRGHSPKITDDGLLVFGRSTGASAVRSGALWSVPLSPDLTSIAGEPTRLREGVAVSGGVRDRWMMFDLAADGTLVHLPGGRTVSRSLVWVDRGGLMEPLLTADDPQLPAGVIGFDAPRISPSGDRIAFRANVPEDQPGFRLFTLELARGAILALSVDANADWPVWTPDGERVVFNRFDAGVHNLYWTRADNVGEPEPLIPENPLQQHAGDFTPDGGTLVLQEREAVAGPDSDIRVIRVGEDDVSRALVVTDAFEIQPVLSPDGRWLAYVSDESGQREVYVTDFPERRTRVKVSTEAAWQPAWTPGGGEIFYRRLDGDAVMTVPYSVVDGALRPGPPSVLFESEGRFWACCVWGRNYDPTLDGRRFVMVAEEAAITSSRLQVVRRWEAVRR
ncbi:MAG: hypothetical protein R3304_13215, partial [Longimicrobiales bacterium]|nr:hypothetical protein [Longimicrobiales bacterium]